MLAALKFCIFNVLIFLDCLMYMWLENLILWTNFWKWKFNHGEVWLKYDKFFYKLYDKCDVDDNKYGNGQANTKIPTIDFRFCCIVILFWLENFTQFFYINQLIGVRASPIKVSKRVS
jgi:hypothetical protein